jgi:hypothetical protein
VATPSPLWSNIVPDIDLIREQPVHRNVRTTKRLKPPKVQIPPAVDVATIDEICCYDEVGSTAHQLKFFIAQFHSGGAA